ncbi:MAG: DegT/DnrJ/EryC1/StrS family aminotransferase, partial [Promethearchaeota archaeon]
EILEKRRENYYYYAMEFSRFRSDLITIEEAENERIGPHAFPIIVNMDAKFTRDDLAYYLQKNGVDSRTLFCSIPTQSAGYKWMGHTRGDFPVAEFVGKNGLHIGVHQDIGKEEREYVVQVVERFFKEEV